MPAEPLFPDDLEHRTRCWNCGCEGLTFYQGVYFHCPCGCGWRNRTAAEVERGQARFKSQTRYYESFFQVEMTDFSQPGVPGSPA